MCNLAFGWGRTGHQIINGNFEAHLPPALHFIAGKSSFYVAHASDADDRKSPDPGESPKHFIDIDYYAAMWSKLDTLVTDRLNTASEALSSLVYSAWLEAGSPSMTGVVSAALPADYHISDLYPNPFNPVTNVDISVPVGSRKPSAVLSVYSSDGRLVRREDLPLASGGNTVPLDFSRYASGMYFVVLNMNGPGIRHQFALKAVYLK